MPVISMFFGIVIRMFYNDHEPIHFHAEYQGQRGKFDLKGKMIVGDVRSGPALRLIKKWAKLHEFEIRQNWQKMKVGKALEIIEPLH